MPCLTRALVLGLVLTWARYAHADPVVEIVELRDGSVFQGELVEKIAGQHVTVKLADGRIRSFAWEDVASAREAGTPPAAAEATTSDAIVSDWPEPNREPPAAWRAHLTVGVAAGIGGPEGYFGVTGGWEPTSWLELEIGAGTGGTFGPALAEMVRVGIPIQSIRVGLGVGFSQNLVGKDDTNLGAPSVAHWLNLESFGDVFVGRHWLFRYTMGWGTLLNSGDFAPVCALTGPGRPSGCDDWGPPTSPASAGAGWSFDLYGSVRVAWLFDI